MTLMQKISLYDFVDEQQRQWALYLLTKAASAGKDLDKVYLLFDRWGGVHLMETVK